MTDNPPLVMVVEDARDIRELVQFILRKDGLRVQAVTNGEDALAQASQNMPDLMLLDLMLPGVDGLAVCRNFKKMPGGKAVPVVMLTSKGEETDIVAGLEMGADDYVVKPFSPRVLVARVHAALRRAKLAASDTDTGPVDEEIAVGDLILRPGRHEVLAGGVACELTATEFKLLHCLMKRPGLVFTRNQLLDALYGELRAVTDRAVDVQVVGLRRKLGAHGDRIETVRGVGYRFSEGE